MAERKKVDKKRRTFENEIEVYKKNNKALCDMLTLYIYFVDKKNEDPAVYIALNEVIKDLEDKDVNVSFKKESIAALVKQDADNYIVMSKKLRENGYDELINQLIEDYRLYSIERYYRSKYINRGDDCLFEQPYDFFGKMCSHYPSFISEILCSNIEMSIKENILYDILKDYLVKNYGMMNLENILDSKGAGMDLSRTNYEVKEQKINELCEAFRIEIENNRKKKEELLDIILRISRDKAVDWVCYLQEKKLVDFMSEKRKINTMHFDMIEASLCVILGVNKLGNIIKIYQLEDYNKLPEKVRANDDRVILDFILANEIPSFISLPNYKTGLGDIEIIGKRVLSYQKYFDSENKELIAQIKSAIIHKAKDKEEYKTYCELATNFEQLADYKAYKEQQEKKRIERERVREQKRIELQNARYQVFLRLFNMNESLQEQVPGKRVIKELVFEKENQDE